MDCGYSLEPPRQSMFWSEMWKKKSDFLFENFQVLVVKCSIYLNTRVFVMIFLFSDENSFWHFMQIVSNVSHLEFWHL